MRQQQITAFHETLERRRGLRAAGLAAALAALVAATPAPASREAKAFPPGCWIGKQPFTGTFGSGPVKAKVTNGKLKFALWVGAAKKDAVGWMTFTGIGAGSLKIGDSELVLEVKILGDYDLTGSPSAVKVNGTFSMTGTAEGTGQFGGSYPVKIKDPVKNAPLTILTVSPTKVTGLLDKGKVPWSATRLGGAPAKNPGTCSKAA